MNKERPEFFEQERIFCVPMKVKRIRFGRCEECGKRKWSTVFYEVHHHHHGLNSHIDLNVCNKCMKKAKKRAKEINDKI